MVVVVVVVLLLLLLFNLFQLGTKKADCLYISKQPGDEGLGNDDHVPCPGHYTVSVMLGFEPGTSDMEVCGLIHLATSDLYWWLLI